MSISDWTGVAFVLILLLTVTVFFYYLSHEQTQVVFDFTGVSNETLEAWQNNTTALPLFFECVKFCSNKFSSDYSKIVRCYNECDKITGTN